MVPLHIRLIARYAASHPQLIEPLISGIGLYCHRKLNKTLSRVKPGDRVELESAINSGEPGAISRALTNLSSKYPELQKLGAIGIPVARNVEVDTPDTTYPEGTYL